MLRFFYIFFISVMFFSQLRIQNGCHDLHVKQSKFTRLGENRKSGILSVRVKKNVYSTSKSKKIFSSNYCR